MFNLPTRLVKIEVVDLKLVNKSGYEKTAQQIETKELKQYKKRIQKQGWKVVSVSKPYITEAIV